MTDLRPLTKADADAVAALIRDAFTSLSTPVDPPPSALRETGENIASIITNGGGGAGAEIDGALAAVCIWQEKDGGLYFGRLSVAPAARGRGLAKALLAAA